ncbi:MAG: VOC family protein [Verrucomicrobiales bacterium]|nr:VOC family protein [Verrucomicrobiales bacterium]
MSTASSLIGSLSEIILYASDMNAQVAFYRDTLGLSVSYPAGLDDYSDQFWVTFETGACVLALHGGGEKEMGKDAPKFVFHSDQIEAARKHLQKQKVPVSEIDSPAPGVQVFDARDPEGNLFSVEAR